MGCYRCTFLKDDIISCKTVGRSISKAIVYINAPYIVAPSSATRLDSDKTEIKIRTLRPIMSAARKYFHTSRKISPRRSWSFTLNNWYAVTNSSEKTVATMAPLLLHSRIKGTFRTILTTAPSTTDVVNGASWLVGSNY